MDVSQVDSLDQEKQSYWGVFLKAAKSWNVVIVQELYVQFCFLKSGLFAKDLIVRGPSWSSPVSVCPSAVFGAVARISQLKFTCKRAYYTKHMWSLGQVLLPKFYYFGSETM